MPTVRRAGIEDLGTLVDFALLAARRRSAADPDLWPLAAGASERVRTSLQGDFGQPERMAWLLAEQAGRPCGAVQVRVVPPPPVYDLGGGLAGLVTEETAVADDAPAGTLAALLDAAEAFMRGAGAVVLVAAVPERWTRERAELAARGYAPLTLWMLKVGAAGPPDHPSVRRATEADLSTLVKLNAEAQALKRVAEPRFWTPHPDAPARFAAWMRTSLGLPDRDLFVTENGDGFAVVQSGTVPAAHPTEELGLIDDFHVRGWNGSLEAPDRSASADHLLSQAEAANTARGRNALLAVCPAAWTAKRDFLSGRGYRTALRWLLKR